MKTNEAREKNERMSIGDFFSYTVFFGIVLGFLSLVLYVIIAIFVGVFGEKEYYENERYIYGVWQNRYFEEYSSGKGVTSTKEINRYYYKTKSGSTYHDNWTTYDISDITVVDDSERERIVIERLKYKNELFNKHFKPQSSEGTPKTKAHYYIHKDTARELGIKVY